MPIPGKYAINPFPNRIIYAPGELHAMNINKIVPSDSVLPHHVVMLAAPYRDEVSVVYSGPLAGVTEDHMQCANLSLMHPGTLAAVKAKADAAVAAKLLQDAPEDDWHIDQAGGGIYGS